MKIAIIDYGASNIQSVCNALKKLGIGYQVVTKPAELLGFDKVIMPGVGAAGSAMEQLKKQGFITSLLELKKPFLGICLGLQLLAEFSEESSVACLGIVPGKVKPLPTDQKSPQIGWNRVNSTQASLLMDGIPNNSYFYFVNSYYFDVSIEFVIAKTNYGISFPSVIQKDNFYATQFHPEKSGEIGLKLLRNFCEKC